MSLDSCRRPSVLQFTTCDVNGRRFGFVSDFCVMRIPDFVLEGEAYTMRLAGSLVIGLLLDVQRLGRGGRPYTWREALSRRTFFICNLHLDWKHIVLARAQI